jgi:hypothetical protein
MATPGCWVDGGKRDILNRINWRFCGSFIMGDRASMDDTWTKVKTHYPIFMRTTGYHIWEVNFWVWLEIHAGWNSGWYAADHNDSIIRIPPTHYSVVASLTTIPSRIESCKNTIDSLLGQVDHVYVAVSKYYRRFGPADDMPPLYVDQTMDRRRNIWERSRPYQMAPGFSFATTTRSIIRDLLNV